MMSESVPSVSQTLPATVRVDSSSKSRRSGPTEEAATGSLSNLVSLLIFSSDNKQYRKRGRANNG